MEDRQAGEGRWHPSRVEVAPLINTASANGCCGELTRTGRNRTRIIQDLPDDLTSEVTVRTL
jgi:hypothetical protein